tara:strand:- start:118 stop:516 length:399 start_codon:yes stop_codon:yes gene_type:complete
MLNLIRILIKKQLIRYIIVGCFSTFINYIVFVLLIFYSKSIFLSTTFGYISGILFSFHFARKWIFYSTTSKYLKSLATFLIIYLLGGLFFSITTKIFYGIGLNHNLAWLIGISLSVINNFLGSKYIVFRKKI